MPQDPFNNVFMQHTAGMHGMFGNVPEPMMRPDIPFGQFFGGDLNGLAASLFLQPVLDQAYGAVGMVPAQFQPMQSLHEQFEAKRYWQSRQNALRTAASADTATYVDVMRNIAKLGDVEFGLEQEAAAQAFAGDIASITPIIAQVAPDWLDRFHGSRGSAVTMAHYMHQGGRFATDAVTGRMGLSGESAGEMARAMQELYFGQDADLSQFRGLSAGKAGQLYAELTARGMGPRSIGTFDGDAQLEQLMGSEAAVESALRNIQEEDPGRFDEFMRRAEASTGRNIRDLVADEQIRALGDTESVAADALRDIEAFNPGEFEQLLRQFDSRRVAERIRNLSGAVSAMRDIFGDMGRPNAPMSELLNGLQALTQGGMAVLSPQQLEHTVRMSYQIARQTGIGLDALMGLTAQGAAHADRLGLERPFAVAGAQGAATFGAAFGEVGGGDMAVWGARDREHLTLMDQQLRLQAATSEMANQMGAAARLDETTPFAAGTAAANFLEAVQNRQTTFIDPATGEARSVDMMRGEFLQMMGQAGIDKSEAAAFLDQTKANEQFIFENDLQDFIRNEFQGQELARTTVAESFQQAAVTQIADRADALGIDRQQAIQLSRIVGEEAGIALMEASAEIQRDPQQRREFVAGRIRQSLIERMTNANSDRIAQYEAEGLTPQQARDRVQREVTTLIDDQFSQDQLLRMSESGYGNLEEAIDSHPALQDYETAQAMLSLHNQETLDRQRAQDQQAEAAVERQAALSGLGRTGPLRRLMNEIRDPHGNLVEAIAHITGGVDDAEIDARLEPLESQLTEAKDRGDLEDVLALRTGGRLAEQRLQALAESQQLSVQDLLRTEDEGLRQRAEALHAAAESGGIRGLRASRTLLEQAAGLQQLHEDFDAAGEIVDPVQRATEQARIARQMRAIREGGTLAGTTLRRLQQRLGLSDEQLQAVIDGEELPGGEALQAQIDRVAEEAGVTPAQLSRLQELEKQAEGRTPGERQRRQRILQLADDLEARDQAMAEAGLTEDEIELITSSRMSGPDALTSQLNTIVDRRRNIRRESRVFEELTESQLEAVRRGEDVRGVSIDDAVRIREDFDLAEQERRVREELTQRTSIEDVARRHREITEERLNLREESTVLRRLNAEQIRRIEEGEEVEDVTEEERNVVLRERDLRREQEQIESQRLDLRSTTSTQELVRGVDSSLERYEAIEERRRSLERQLHARSDQEETIVEQQSETRRRIQTDFGVTDDTMEEHRSVTEQLRDVRRRISETGRTTELTERETALESQRTEIESRMVTEAEASELTEGQSREQIQRTLSERFDRFQSLEERRETLERERRSVSRQESRMLEQRQQSVLSGLAYEYMVDEKHLEEYRTATSQRTALRREHDVFTRLSREQIEDVEREVVASDIIRERGVTREDVQRIREGDDAARPDLTPQEIAAIRQGVPVTDVTDADRQIIQRDVHLQQRAAAAREAIEDRVAAGGYSEQQAYQMLQQQREELRRDNDVFAAMNAEQEQRVRGAIAEGRRDGRTTAELAAALGMTEDQIEAFEEDMQLQEQQRQIVTEAATRAALPEERRAEFQQLAEERAAILRTAEAARTPEQQARLEAIDARRSELQREAETAKEATQTESQRRLQALIEEKGLTNAQLDAIRAGARAEIIAERMGLSEEQVQEIAAGEDVEGVDEETQQELRDLIAQRDASEVTPEISEVIRGAAASRDYSSFDETFELQGIITDSQVTGEHTLETERATRTLQERMEQLASGAVTPADEEGQAAYRDISRAVEMRESILNVALSDEATFRQLGRAVEDREAGGVAGLQAHELLTSTRALRDQQLEQARSLGYGSIAEMLAHEADNADVQAIESQLQERTAEIDRRMHLEHRDRERVTESELAEYQERKTRDLRTAESSLQELAALGVIDAELSDAKQKELAAIIGEGGYDAARRFSEMVDARSELEDLAKAEAEERGEAVTVMDLVRDSEGSGLFSELTDEQRERVQELQERAGRLLELGDVHEDEDFIGRTESVLQGVLEEIARESVSTEREEDDDSGTKTVQRVTGTVRLLEDGEHAIVDLIPARNEDTPTMLG